MDLIDRNARSANRADLVDIEVDYWHWLRLKQLAAACQRSSLRP